MDKWQVYKKTDEFRVQTPKSVLDVVEIKSIDEHGNHEKRSASWQNDG